MIQQVPPLGVNRIIVIAEAEKPYVATSSLHGTLEIVNCPWTLEIFPEAILQADVVLNPRLDSGRWRYKSDNKTTTAWALGLPVAHNLEELRLLQTEEARQHEADRRYVQVREACDVRASIEDYEVLIERLRSGSRQPAYRPRMSLFSGLHEFSRWLIEQPRPQPAQRRA